MVLVRIIPILYHVYFIVEFWFLTETLYVKKGSVANFLMGAPLVGTHRVTFIAFKFFVRDKILCSSILSRRKREQKKKTVVRGFGKTPRYGGC